MGEKTIKSSKPPHQLAFHQYHSLPLDALIILSLSLLSKAQHYHNLDHNSYSSALFNKKFGYPLPIPLAAPVTIAAF